MENLTIRGVVDRWESPNCPKFSLSLLGKDNTCCPQADILRMAGWSDEKLTQATQHEIDVELTKLLGISLMHAIMIRSYNCWLSKEHPEKVLKASELPALIGVNWRLLLAFGRHMDTLTDDAWVEVFRHSKKPRDSASEAEMLRCMHFLANDKFTRLLNSVIDTKCTGITTTAEEHYDNWMLCKYAMIELQTAEQEHHFLRAFFADPNAWIAAHKNDSNEVLGVVD